MENKKAEVRLAGKWRLNRTFTVTAAEKKNLMLFNDQEYIVDFSADGIMTETSAGETTAVTYQFEPTTRTINFQQSSRCQPSPISGVADSCFRVIPINESEMYFMSPTSLENDSDEFEIILLECVEQSLF